MRALLVGGAGFMGARSARALRDAGHDVTVLTRGHRPVPQGVESLVADRSDPDDLSRALDHRRFDFTVDFVAYDADHVETLLCVPYAALGRYVLISTGQVYLVTAGAPAVCREPDSAAPLSPEPAPGTPDHAEWRYGVGKRRAEGALLSLRASHGVRGTVLRLPVVQGEDDPSLRLWAWLERMLDGGPVLLPEGGTRPTRFLYAGDVAAALVRLIDGPVPNEPVYNLAQPDVLSLREFLERVARAAGLEPTFVDVSWEELARAGIDRAAMPYAGPWSSVLDPSQASVELGLAMTRVDDYLAGVVRRHVELRPERSHSGYAGRGAELEIGARRASSRAPS